MQHARESGGAHGSETLTLCCDRFSRVRSTALGVIFCSLEDETGTANLIIRPTIYSRFRKEATGAVALITEGRVERQGEVAHLQTARIEDVSHALDQLRSVSRDFH